jgi:hypothetical protein
MSTSAPKLRIGDFCRFGGPLSELIALDVLGAKLRQSDGQLTAVKLAELFADSSFEVVTPSVRRRPVPPGQNAHARSPRLTDPSIGLAPVVQPLPQLPPSGRSSPRRSHPGIAHRRCAAAPAGGADARPAPLTPGQQHPKMQCRQSDCTDRQFPVERFNIGGNYHAGVKDCSQRLAQGSRTCWSTISRSVPQSESAGPLKTSATLPHCRQARGVAGTSRAPGRLATVMVISSPSSARRTRSEAFCRSSRSPTVSMQVPKDVQANRPRRRRRDVLRHHR